MIAQIIGWGSEKFVQPNIPLNAVNMSLVLKKMTVKIISYTVCKHFYKNLVFDKEIIACGDGFHETATSKVCDFINFTKLKIFFKKYFEK